MVKEAVVTRPTGAQAVAKELRRGIETWEKGRGIGKPADLFIIRRHLGRVKGYAVRVMEGNERGQQKTMIAEWKRRTLDEADDVHAQVLTAMMELSGFQGVIATSADASDAVLGADDVDWGEVETSALPKGATAEPDPVFQMLTEACCWACDNARRYGLSLMEELNRYGNLGGMIVCPTCGNKRCPKASWHENECSGSNEPGQEGPIYK